MESALVPNQLSESLIEALVYVRVIITERASSVVEAAQKMLRKLLDQFVERDKEWLLTQMAEWLKVSRKRMTRKLKGLKT